MSRLSLLVIPVVSACAYSPGSFSSYTSSFPGTRATVGCLDVSASLTKTERGPVATYTVGNRCDSVAVVDFSAIRARSNELSLAPFDPRGELRPLRIEPRSVISERIEYPRPASAAISGVCLDVGGLNGAAGTERWLCQDAGAPGLVASNGGAR